MKTKILFFLLIINISAFAQNVKNLSNIVGGTSIFENNKIYGKVKTIENVCVADTNFVNELMNIKYGNLHFNNYFLAFDSATNIIEKRVDKDICPVHKKFIYNGNVLIESDLEKNTETKFIFSDEKRVSTQLLAEEWLDSTNTPRRRNYSFSLVYNSKKRLESYTRTIFENDSVISKRKYDCKFCYDNQNKIRYNFCYYLPEKKYKKGKKYDTHYYIDKDSNIYQIFIYFNKRKQATKYLSMLKNKKDTEIFYEYDYNILKKVIKHHYFLNVKSIYTYNSREFLIRKEVFNDIKAKIPTKIYNFYYEFDIHGNWVKMSDYDTDKILVERKITYY